MPYQAMEVELKLLLDPADNARLVRHPLLAAHARARQRKARLTARYFDTPELYLLRHGAGLRVRQADGLWTQTMKAGGSVQGGLHARLEWEGPVTGDAPQLGKLRKLMGDDRYWQQVLDVPGLGRQLQPLFSVEVEHSTWELDYDGSVIELVLDEGRINRLGRHLPVNEIELELKSGHPASLFAFALALLETVPLQVSNVNKAERGYALCLDKRAAAVKAAPLAVPCDASTGQALQAVLANCLHHMQDNEAAVIDGADSESLHQLRVGARRLRSALRLFAACAPCPAALLGDLAWLGTELGAARDWDVLAKVTLPRCIATPDGFDDAAAMTALRDHVFNAARTHRRAAASALQSPRYAHLMLGLNQWLLQLQLAAATEPARHNPLARPAAAFARRALQRLHNKLLHRADTARKANRAKHGPDHTAAATGKTAAAAGNTNTAASQAPAADGTGARAVHRLRIAGKRCRYGVEFFASLLRERSTQRYLKQLASLQDQLGSNNDLVVADQLLLQCRHATPSHGAADAVAALAFVRGYLHALRAQDASAVGAACAAVRRFRLPRLARPA
ncbi:MAG: CYTH and CHAD domain-containing protein [Pseudomonadota bacterium]